MFYKPSKPVIHDTAETVRARLIDSEARRLASEETQELAVMDALKMPPAQAMAQALMGLERRVLENRERLTKAHRIICPKCQKPGNVTATSATCATCKVDGRLYYTLVARDI